MIEFQASRQIPGVSSIGGEEDAAEEIGGAGDPKHADLLVTVLLGRQPEQLGERRTGEKLRSDVEALHLVADADRHVAARHPHLRTSSSPPRLRRIGHFRDPRDQPLHLRIEIERKREKAPGEERERGRQFLWRNLEDGKLEGRGGGTGQVRDVGVVASTSSAPDHGTAYTDQFVSTVAVAKGTEEMELWECSRSE
ncbi:hypothetical protein KSP39_PZI010081 [Platanthera zijinensis]|uniref:Uncharacterized protein n=1 Tax=Platanthera zijinensis TaxID=2320716 RepID=A0AAP0G6U4_9ASPA